MKKLLIIATIISMLATPLCAYAQSGAKVALAGVYEAYNDIKILHNVEGDANYKWFSSTAKDGTYNEIDGAVADTYLVKTVDMNNWIKAVVTDSEANTFETEPRQITPAWDYKCTPGTMSPFVYFTPQEYSFTVEGQKFIFLEVTEGESSHILAMCQNSIGERAFDPENSQSCYDMVAFLNNKKAIETYQKSDIPRVIDTADYEQDGYIQSEYVQIAKPVFDAIDFNHVWKVESRNPGRASGYSIRGGIMLPSHTEMEKYAHRIGLRDSGDDKHFWLRTPSGSTRTDALSVNVGTHAFESTAVTLTKSIRPIFYINKDFFIKNKVESMGAEVSNYIFSEYTKEQLLTLYTEQELKNVGYVDLAIKDLTIEKGSESSVAKVNIQQGLGADGEMVLMVAAYDADGMLSGVDMNTVTCSFGKNEASITLTGVTEENGASFMAVILDSASNLVPKSTVIVK